MCVCVFERERGREGGREREKEKKKNRERECVCVCESIQFSQCVCLFTYLHGVISPSWCLHWSMTSSVWLKCVWLLALQTCVLTVTEMHSHKTHTHTHTHTHCVTWWNSSALSSYKTKGPQTHFNTHTHTQRHTAQMMCLHPYMGKWMVCLAVVKCVAAQPWGPDGSLVVCITLFCLITTINFLSLQLITTNLFH